MLILTIVGTVLNLLPTTEAQAQASGSGNSKSYYSDKFKKPWTFTVTGACRGCPVNRPLGNGN